MLPNDLIVYERSMIHFAPGSPGQLAIFDAPTGVRAQLYSSVYADMGNPGDQGSPHRARFIARLRVVMEKWNHSGNTPTRFGFENPYGFDPEWFDASYDKYAYDATSDTLRFTAALAFDRHPDAIAPPLRDVYTVTCRPMRSATRRCVER